MLLVFCIFAACILMVLLTGANSYQMLTSRDADSFSRRLCVQYVAAKIRHSDADSSIYIGDFEGSASDEGNTLFLRESVNGENYLTRIYCYKGYLRELYAAADEDMHPEDGEVILTAKSLTFSMDPKSGLLKIENVDGGGQQQELSIFLRSEKRVGA